MSRKGMQWLRRGCGGLLALSVLCALVRPVAAQTIVAGPATTDLQGVAGDRLTMPIAVDLTGAPGIKLGSYRLSVRWKTAALKFIATGGAAFAAPVFNTDSAAQGVVKWAGANASGATGFFTLGSITFEVVSTGQADTLKLAFQEMTAAETFTNLLPQLTLTGTVFCGGPVWGDMNADGILQALDAQIVLMHAVGTAVADTTRGDVDADTRVNPRDALIILSKVVGLSSAPSGWASSPSRLAPVRRPRVSRSCRSPSGLPSAINSSRALTSRAPAAGSCSARAWPGLRATGPWPRWTPTVS